MTLVRSRDSAQKATQKQNFDQRHRSVSLPPLAAGEEVWMPSHNCEATVGNEVAPRSYEVTTPSGATIRRNRRDLTAMPEQTRSPERPPSSDMTEHDSSDDTSIEDGNAEGAEALLPDTAEEQLPRRSTRVRLPRIPYDPSGT